MIKKIIFIGILSFAFIQCSVYEEEENIVLNNTPDQEIPTAKSDSINITSEPPILQNN